MLDNFGREIYLRIQKESPDIHANIDTKIYFLGMQFTG